MKTRSTSFKTLLLTILLIVAIVVCALPWIVATAASVVNDTFADGNSQNQDLANNSIRIFQGRSTTVRTDAVGSVNFNLAGTTSAEAFWGFFTNSGAPVNLNVGDKLTVSGTFSMTGFGGTGQDIRFGVLNSLGTRNANNLTGGMNETSFVNDPGYALDYFASGTGGSPFTILRRTNLTQGNVFNAIGDFTAITGTGATVRQPLTNNTSYTLTYSIERLSATDTRISVAVTGGALTNFNFTSVESSVSPNTAFDYFGFRVANNTFAQQIKFTNWLIDYTAALPVITSQPQPSNLTVQVGSNVTMAVAASGNQLSYQWQQNGAPISAAVNPSAITPTLNLSNVQLGDAGTYVAVVSNPSGSVSSNPVTLNVSTDPVPPPPGITTQPADTTVTVGNPAALSVIATGDNLFYQWFKNGTLIPGATGASLNFANAQIGDVASYTVVVSNSSGSITSTAAKLLVVSAMTVTTTSPNTGATDLCIDTPLRITFNQPPKVGTTGRLVVHQDDGAIVDTIDMSLANQSRLNGTVSFNYFPIIVTGNTAAIYLHQKLAYDRTYFVTIEPGVITDTSGAPFAGITNPNQFAFSTKTSGPAPGTNALTVAADGSGDFCTVQGAVDFIPAGNSNRAVINVRNGTYTEIVYVGSNKPFITVRGEDRALTVIQYANNNNFNPTSTTTRAMFGVDGNDFSLENITLQNTTPKGGSQAEAFRGNALRIVLNRVNLKSFQDTLLLQSPGTNSMGGFVNDSYIEGDVDFVWGNGSAYFQNCELKMLTSSGFYTQIRNVQGKSGNVFVNCRLTGAAGVTGGFLGRIDPGVFPFSQVVYINCAMGPQVIPVGWRLDNATSAPNVQFWEYNSTDLNGAPLDVSQRPSFSRQLTPAEAAQWSDPAFVLGGFTPSTKLTAAVSLSNLNQTFTGAPIVPTVVTEPAGLNVTLSYNGSPNPPTALGSYNVVATIQDAVYQGSFSGTLVINPVSALVTLGKLYQTYDGTPKPVSVNVTPAGTPINVTYNGSIVPPTDVGQYSVIATINDPNFQGGTSATLTIYAPGTAPLRAFPGAEGSGALTPGGRGGDVYHVTNLNDSGPGSLRSGVQTASGPRTIVFDLSGTIYLISKLSINKPFITLAGQTAPGDGITVAGWTTAVTDTHDVIVRYMRFRPGDVNCPNYQDDGFTVDRSINVIVDHVSASWSVDETLSVTESDKVTVQWSLITESMKNSCHIKGAHGYGSLIRYGSGLITYHHNLYAHHDSRNPRLGDNIGLDFVNNLVYDWGSEAGYSGDNTEGTPRLNYVGNYLVAGASTPSSKRSRAFNGGGTATQIYQSNNAIDSNFNGAHDGQDTQWSMFIGLYTKQQPGRFSFPQVATDDAPSAYARVLNLAGHSLVRDAVDTRVISEVRNEGGHHINSENEVGGWPALNSLTPPVDTDQDGIPDAWENDHGLNALDPADGAAISASGYSNLETYLNDLVPFPDADKDHTAPATLASPSEPPNAAGWNNSDVTVTLTAADNPDGTGVRETFYSVNGTQFHVFGASVSIPVATEGVTTIDFFARDNAGNTETSQSLTIKLDKTAPVFTNVSRTPANANGWNNTDVESSFTATDSVSGFAGGSTENGSFTFTQEGADQTHTFTVTDQAGNSASATVSDVNIDKTSPIIEAVPNPAPNSNGWNNTNVIVSFNASDALSGIFSSSGPVTLTNEGAAQVVTGTAMDRAGNTATVNISINIDKTAPEALVQFDPILKEVVVFGRDPLSGVPAAAVPPVSVIPGNTELRTYEVIDGAGNTLTLVLAVKAEGHEIQAEIVSLQYNGGPIVGAPANQLRYKWETEENGALRKLDQDLRIDSSPDQEVEADYRADRHQTVIRTKHPKVTTVQAGLVLLRFASVNGQVVIEQ
jgi:pectin methylesterase-like acyl-CoA thioesterase